MFSTGAFGDAFKKRRNLLNISVCTCGGRLWQGGTDPHLPGEREAVPPEAVPRRRPPPGRLGPALSAVLKRPRREGRGAAPWRSAAPEAAWRRTWPPSAARSAES